jgi:uncharacterized protein (UPF0218 family)
LGAVYSSLSGTHPLPESLRASLKEPLGIFIPDSQVTKEAVSSKLFGRNRIIVAIGDRTNERMKEFKIFSNLEMIDGSEKRVKKDSIPPFSGDKERLLKVNNPAGQITEESLAAIRNGLELIRSNPKKAVRIEVDGEEDLLVLPVLAFYPEQTIVLYGQPNEGLVITGASGESRNIARKALEEMGIRSL